STAQTYVKTLVGTDFHSLDQAVFAELAPNTGGAIYPLALGDLTNALPDDMYFEARVELPVGARVTEVTFIGCGPAGNGSYYFADYNLLAATYEPLRPEAYAASSSCPTLRALKRTGNPITTVAAGRSYHLGAHTFALGNFRTSNPIWQLHGARVK